jgi:allantoate deiminase
MLTSRAVAGALDPTALAIVGDDGISLRDALAASGLAIEEFADARHTGALAYLEAHIEQGPVLEAEGLPVGCVTAIAAQHRYSITVSGSPGHAGTTAMRLRRDALAAAAEMILAVESLARSGGEDLVATVGRIEALPGAANVVPGSVTMTVDVRAGTDDARNEAANHILARIAAIAAQRQLGLTYDLLQDLPATQCDTGLMAHLDAAIEAAGVPARRLVSGAGHDAMIMRTLCPVAMLFVRCVGGISHNPAERVDPADVEVALHVMRRFIDRLGDLGAA